MSGALEENNLSHIILKYAYEVCYNWVGGWYIGYISWMDWLPFYIFIVNVVAGFWSRDFFFWFMNGVLTIDWLANIGLTQLINQPSLQGPHCIYGPQFPAYTTDIIFAYFGCLKFLQLLMRMPPLNMYNTFYVYLLVFVSVAQRVGRLINSPESLVAGAVVGIFWAVLAVLVLEFIFKPLSFYLKKTYLYRWCGITNYYFDREKPYKSYSLVELTPMVSEV